MFEKALITRLNKPVAPGSLPLGFVTMGISDSYQLHFGSTSYGLQIYLQVIMTKHRRKLQRYLKHIAKQKEISSMTACHVPNSSGIFFKHRQNFDKTFITLARPVIE